MRADFKVVLDACVLANYGVVKELAKRQPLRAVFRDSGYANDAVKINFEQIFKALSPHTELKTL